MAASSKQRRLGAGALLMIVSAGVWLTHSQRTGTAQSHLDAVHERKRGGAPAVASAVELGQAPLARAPVSSNPVVAARIREDMQLDPGSTAPGHFDRELEARKRQSDDPVAAAIPMLSHRTKAQQLRTLRWMASIPGEKLVSAFPDLMNADVALAEREQVAREWLSTLARDLEGTHDG